jgi:hypothetical protein
MMFLEMRLHMSADDRAQVNILEIKGGESDEKPGITREPVGGVVAGGTRFSKIVRWVSSGLELAVIFGLTQARCADQTWSFFYLPEEGRSLVNNNFGACSTCGTMRTVVAAIGNMYKIHARYINDVVPLATDVTNAVYAAFGQRKPLIWLSGSLDSSASIAAVNPEYTPLVDRLRDVRRRRKVNCGFDSEMVPGFASMGASGRIEGFEVDLCAAIAYASIGEARSEFSAPGVARAAALALVNPVFVRAENKFEAVRNGTVDVLFGASCTIGGDLVQQTTMGEVYHIGGYGVLLRDPEFVDDVSAIQNANSVCLMNFNFVTVARDGFANKTIEIVLLPPGTTYATLSDALDSANCDMFFDRRHTNFMACCSTIRDQTDPITNWHPASWVTGRDAWCMYSRDFDFEWSQILRFTFERHVRHERDDDARDYGADGQ